MDHCDKRKDDSDRKRMADAAVCSRYLWIYGSCEKFSLEYQYNMLHTHVLCNIRIAIRGPWHDRRR